jgi:hypothetical protein
VNQITSREIGSAYTCDRSRRGDRRSPEPKKPAKTGLPLQGGRHGGYQSQNNAGDAETKRIGVCGFEHFGSTAG